MSDDVRNRILESAAKCFLAADYKKVTTREIAARADVNSAMIAYYFGSKSQLFEAVIKEHFAEIYLKLDSLSKPPTLEEGLTQSWDVYYKVMTENPELPRLMVRAMVYGDVPGHDYLVEHILGRKMDKFVGRIKEQQKSGDIRQDISPKLLWLMGASIAMMPVVFTSLIGTLIDEESEEALEQLAQTAGKVLSKGLMS